LASSLTSFENAYARLQKERPGVLASELGGELAWLRKARERDVLRWRSEGLPTRRNEAWKYTSIAPITDSDVVLADALDTSKPPPRADFAKFNVPHAAEIAFYNGHFVPQWSDLGAVKGLSVLVLSELLEECINDGWTPERKERLAAFREHVETSDADRENVFAAMNTSFMQDAVLIWVDDNVSIKEPVVVSFYSEEKKNPAELSMSAPRVFAHLGKNARAGLVEFYSGREGARYFVNAVSDVRLEEGAKLSHCKLQSESAKAIHVGTTRIHQKRSSFAETFQFSFGAELSRQELHIGLDGEGAETVLDGLYMVKDKQHVDHHTCVDHMVPHTSSQQVYKGILDGDARAVFNGRVHIHRDAQKSNAAQLNKNLLLSAKAEVDTKPELEIDADDVKAAHGATIGQIDPEHVFYLQARSIPKDQAVQMLARGFAKDVVFKIGDEHIRAALDGWVDKRFDLLGGGLRG
jgi:Fe-S cluster assembly protein SufD